MSDDKTQDSHQRLNAESGEPGARRGWGLREEADCERDSAEEASSAS